MVLIGHSAEADDGAVSGDDRIHRLHRLAPALIVETRRRRDERREREAGQTIRSVRLHHLMQRLLHRRPHLGIVIERMGKPPLSGRNGKAGILELHRAPSSGQVFLAEVARQGSQESAQELFQKRPVCSVVFERGLVACAFRFPVGDDRLMVLSLRERSNPWETGAEEPHEHPVPLRIQEAADRSDAKRLEPRRGFRPDARQRPQGLRKEEGRFQLGLHDGKAIWLGRISGDLRDGFAGGHSDRACEAGGIPDRLLHEPRQDGRIRVARL